MSVKVTLDAPVLDNGGYVLCLLGHWPGFTDGGRDLADRLAKNGRACDGWSHRINEAAEARLRAQPGGFWVYISAGAKVGGTGNMFSLRFRVVDFVSGPKGSLAPHQELAVPEAMGKTSAGGKQSELKTWFVIDRVERVDPVILSKNIGPPALWNGTKSLFPDSVQKSFGYRWLPASLAAQSDANRVRADTGAKPAATDEVLKTEVSGNDNSTERRPQSRVWLPGLNLWLEDLSLQGLKAPFNLILEGVPGTTKTYAVKQLAEKFVDPAAKGSFVGNGQGRYAMTMHPATAYEDFVEGMRPGSQPGKAIAPTVNVVKWKDATTTPPAGSSEVPATYMKDNVVFEFPAPAEDEEAPVPVEWFFQAPTSGDGAFAVHDGFFVSVCADAYRAPSKLFVVLLDEINRCNIPKVMGDLLTTIERSKRATWVLLNKEGEANPTDAWDVTDVQIVTLPYSKRKFFVPDNVIVIGTMNTTDRSVAPMDAALRRRFAFVRTWPMGFGPNSKEDNEDTVLDGVKSTTRKFTFEADKAMKESVQLWHRINMTLKEHGDDAMLGHSYLFDLATDLSAVISEDESSSEVISHILRAHWNLYIFPQIVDIIQSNDLNGKVFPKEPNGSISNLKDKLFDGDWSMTSEGNWTNRGTGMLKVPTLRLE